MRLLSAALGCLLMFTGHVLAAPSTSPIRVVFPYIPLMAESKDHGVFIDMYAEIARRSDTDVVIDILPVRRAVQDFISGKYDALGAYPSLSEIPVSLASVPFYRRENLIFTALINLVMAMSPSSKTLMARALDWPPIITLTTFSIVRNSTLSACQTMRFCCA